MKKLVLDSFIVGMALFAMFFGAGNIIFPPYIGLGAGTEWVTGFICYFIADIGLALLTIFAMMRSDCSNKTTGLMHRLGKVPSMLMMGAIVLCIGPLLAVPRTAATTFEIAIAPHLGDDGAQLFIFTILFFLLVLVFSIRESKMVDIVGKYLTPIKFCGFMIIIIGGAMSPIGPLSETVRFDNLKLTGIIAGYQTMDVLAAMLFGLIIINALKLKGHTSKSDSFFAVGLASIIAAVLLFIIYGGLCYLGSTVSTLYPMDIDRGRLVVIITESLFGSYSSILLGIVISASCLATAIALTSATGTFFSKISNGMVSYNKIVIGVCVFSTLAANFGLEAIINFAVPILGVIYPGAIVVAVLSLFSEKIINDHIMRYATAGAMIISLGHVLYTFGLPLGFLNNLPFHSVGFGWTLPAILFGAAGYLINKSIDSQFVAK